ncbi:MAG TPA: hypothetical protein VFW07_05160 [Parafilimonas sp.]|nr:hypothetical protein [Parafilimonas sp.]
MLLQLANTHKDDLSKLLAYAKENHLTLSLADEDENNYVLPGKALTDQQLQKLIERSRKSGVISMKNAHDIISKSYNAD